MPLIKSKSKKAIRKNIAAEESVGKPKAGAKIPRGKSKKSEGNTNPKRAGESG